MSGAANASPDGIGPFVAKWRSHWPEWNVVEAFLPAEVRIRVDAWEALQFELQEAAWAGADPTPGEAKLGWWVEELDGWGQGRRRHPIGSVLQRIDAPWLALARSLPQLASTRERPMSGAEARAGLGATADAVAAIDASIAGGMPANAAVVASWLLTRLARHPASAVPLDALAAGESEGRRAWMQDMLASWPSAGSAPRPRKLLAVLARERLRRGDAPRPLGPLTSLRLGWRAARD